MGSDLARKLARALSVDPAQQAAMEPVIQATLAAEPERETRAYECRKCGGMVRPYEITNESGLHDDCGGKLHRLGRIDG